MGNTLERDFESERQISRSIDRLLKAEKSRRKNEVPMILIGMPNAGKSTFFKQMKLLSGHRLDPAEKSLISTKILENIFQGLYFIMNELLRLEGSKIVGGKNHIVYSLKELFEAGKLDCQTFRNQTPAEIADQSHIIETFCKDSETVRFIETDGMKSPIVQVAESFFNDIGRILSPDFDLKPNDWLRCRIPTQGVHDILFKGENNRTKFRVIDVGGQKSERRKWIHHFEFVLGIVFIVAISEYDELYEEDNQVFQALRFCLNLFGEVLQNKFLQGKPVILLLNKIDIFKEKLKTSNIKNFYPDYNASKYIRGLFRKKTESVSPNRVLHAHFTHATDVKQSKKVILSISDFLLRQSLTGVGIDTTSVSKSGTIASRQASSSALASSTSEGKISKEAGKSRNSSHERS